MTGPAASGRTRNPPKNGNKKGPPVREGPCVARGRPPSEPAAEIQGAYTTPWSIIASATLMKPAMLAPFT